MQENSEAFVGLDTSKQKISVAIADTGRGGEVRFFGDIDSAPAMVERMVKKLAKHHRKLRFCYEAGPTGYGLHRQITALGHECIVVAPSLIPQRPGERAKTNRRDAVSLAKLHRAGELTEFWVPDPVHEAVRELARARETEMEELRRARQHLQSFLRPATAVHFVAFSSPQSLFSAPSPPLTPPLQAIAAASNSQQKNHQPTKNK